MFSQKSAVEQLRDEIGYYSAQLRGCIDVDALLRAYQTPRRNERMDAYHPILRDACCACFRGTNIRDDGKRCTVWGFDGRLWKELSSVVFCDAVGDAIKAAAGSGAFVVKGDWIDRQQKFLESAYKGVCASPLSDGSSVVGFSNGVWDFSDVDNPVCHGFGDRLPVTSLLPYAYDPAASCPLWESFLNMMLSPADVVKLQKYLGLGVVNRRRMGHIVEETLWLIGGGANGKSTILNVVREVYGHDNVSNASMRALFDRNQDARMRAVYSIEGRVFNVCSEMDMQDISRDSDAFKRLCSGEAQTARGIGKDIHDAEDIPFLIFAMNQRPSNRRMDAAFRRRIVEIQFNVSVRPEDMDSSLGEKLKGELSGIRNWMIEGYRRLVADGFRFGAGVDGEYMESNEQYFDMFCESEGLRPSGWAGRRERGQLVSASVLHERFCEFCQRNLLTAVSPSPRALAQDLKRLGYRSHRKAAGVFYTVYSDNELDYTIKL